MNKIYANDIVKNSLIELKKSSSEKKAQIYAKFLLSLGKKKAMEFISYLWSSLQGFRVDMLTEALKKNGSKVLDFFKKYSPKILSKFKILGANSIEERKLINIITAADAGEETSSIVTRFISYLKNSTFAKFMDKFLAKVPFKKILIFLSFGVVGLILTSKPAINVYKSIYVKSKSMAQAFIEYVRLGLGLQAGSA